LHSKTCITLKPLLFLRPKVKAEGGKNIYHAESDIDLAVFWDRDYIDGFDENVLLRKLC
jgi:hypothetical protein